MAWPTEVPILNGRDFIRGSFGVGARHCIAGWRTEVFGPSTLCSKQERVKVRKALVAENPSGPQASIVGTNDDPSVPLSELARWWNRTMARLGYVVSNPEAKNVK